MHKARLALCAIVVAASAGYAVLVAADEGLASAVALGYVALLLTVLVIIAYGKRYHEKIQHRG